MGKNLSVSFKEKNDEEIDGDLLFTKKPLRVLFNLGRPASLEDIAKIQFGDSNKDLRYHIRVFQSLEEKGYVVREGKVYRINPRVSSLLDRYFRNNQ